MTKTQLINKLKDKFSIMGQEKQTGEEILDNKKVTHLAIPVADIVNDTLTRQWVHYYVDENDSAYWQDGEPKKEITPVITFRDRLQTFIDAKITDNTVKFAIIKELNETTKTAKCEAIMPDKLTKTLIVKEGAIGTFTIEQI